MNARFGVNYVPSKNWWYCWQDWDAASIQADLEAVAALGMDHIRIHCLWSYFQPSSGYVSETALKRLSELLDIAHTYQLDVVVTVLDGWLSGLIFKPAWVQERNLFTDEKVMTAIRDLFRIIAEHINDHPAFYGFDLGNELGVLQTMDDACTPAEADRWNADMLNWCAEVAPGKFHVNGVDHVHWFRNLGFTRAALATTGSATSLHTWIGYTGVLERYGPKSTASLHLTEYAIELAKAYQMNFERPLWIQEFGAITQWMDLDFIPDFAEHSIRSALSCTHVWGMTWWCSHDIDESVKDFGIGEYHLGLLDIHNHRKPAGQRIADLITAFKDAPPPPIARTTALVMPDDLIDEDESCIWHLVDAFMQLIDQGLHPAIVLESHVDDFNYLSQRGIQHCIPLHITKRTHNDAAKRLP